MLKEHGHSDKSIGLSLGYRWPGNYSRFVARAASQSLLTGPVQNLMNDPFENMNILRNDNSFFLPSVLLLNMIRSTKDI